MASDATPFLHRLPTICPKKRILHFEETNAFMKKLLTIFALFFALLLLAALITPFFLKEPITQRVKQEANKQINAHFYFDELGLSFFRHFPQATISIHAYGLVGKDLFEGDTLIQGKRFDLVVNPFRLLSEGAISLQEIRLDAPKLHILILEDGTANYDIVRTDSIEVEPESEETSDFLVKLASYTVTDGTIIYDDATLPMRLEIEGLSHRGAGDFTAITYDLRTQSQAERLNLTYDGLTYLNEAVVDADMDMHIEMEPVIKVTFLENTATVNALPIGLDGYIALPEEDIDMDVRFASRSASFQSLLSMVPGVYTEEFASIETEGSLEFKGFAKGIYNASQYPAFGLDLVARDAWFKYPDLPTPVSGIEVDLHLTNPDGDLEKTTVDVKRFHADFGNNPIDARLKVSGLQRMQLSADVQARLNLAELTQMIPMEGTRLRGLFELQAQAEGLYDEAANAFPTVDAQMVMQDGYVKNEAYPVELTNFGFTGSMANRNGSMANTVLDVPRFHFDLDNEPIDGQLYVENLEDPAYRLQASGSLDLEKLMKLYPVEGTELSGTLVVNEFSTSGRMSDIEAERYTALPTRGDVQVQGLRYKDATYPELRVDQARARFTPERLEIEEARGTLGKSDYAVNGYVGNYLAYALMDDQPLTGEMTLQSQALDLNEWMQSTPVATPEAEEEALSVIPVPENVAVDFRAEIGELTYGKLTLRQLDGQLAVAEEAINMKQLGFNVLGAAVQMNGAYNTQNQRQPLYEFFMDVKQLGIKDAYTYFNTVQAFAPIAQYVEGVCNLTFGIQGKLKPNMMPYLEGINSLGMFEVLDGGLDQLPLLQQLSASTQLQDLSSLQLRDLKGNFQIQEGALEVEPFTVQHKDIALTLGGKQFITGAMDYQVDLDFPAGKLGQAALTSLSQATGGVVQPRERLSLSFDLGGTFKSPQVQGLGSPVAKEAKSRLAEAAEDKLQEKLGTDVPLDSAERQAAVDSLKTTVRDSATEVLSDVKERARDSLERVTEKLKDSLENKVEEQFGDEVKTQLDSLKKVLGLPKFGKKKQKN